MSRLLSNSYAKPAGIAWPVLGADDGHAETWSLGPPALMLAVVWLVFSWPWLIGNVTIPWDAKAHFAPQAQFLAQSLAGGESPFWLPYAFSGTLQIADPQSLIFSPPFLLLALVDGNPGPWAIDMTVFVSLLLSGVTVLLLARELGWHWLAALIGAVAFLFGASMAWRLQHFGQVLSLAYLPIAIFLLRRALDRQSWAYGAGAGAAAAAILLGRDQVGLIAIYTLAGYGLWRLAEHVRSGVPIGQFVSPLAAATVTGCLLAVPPLVLTLLYAAISNRPEIDFIGAGRGSLHPALMVTAAIPHLFGAAGEMALYWGPPSFTWVGTDLFIAQNMGQLYLGAIPLLLLIAGVSRGLVLDRAIAFLSIAFVVVTLYAVGWFTPVFRLMYELVPGVKMFRRPADATFLMGGFAALVAAFVAHHWWSGTLPAPTRPQRIVEAGLVALPFLAAIVFAVWLDRVDRAIFPFLLAVAWFAGAGLVLIVADWLKLVRPGLAAMLVIGFVAVDITANNGPNGATALPSRDLAMLDPATDNATIRFLKAEVAAHTSISDRPRVELAGLGFHWPNASLPHRLENVLGYNPVRLQTYAAATGAGDTVGLPDQRNFTPPFPSYNSILADLLGLRFIATGVPVGEIDKRIGPDDLLLRTRTADAFIYENPRALPRVRFATRAVAGDFDRMIASGVWPVDRSAVADTVVLAAPGTTPVRRPGKVEIVSYRHTEVVLDAESPDGGYAVLADIWHPWWQTTLDGQPVEMLKADVLFRAVAVPPGRHRIVFRLAPWSGAWRDLVGLVAGDGKGHPPG